MQLWLIDVRFPVLQFLFRPRDGFCRRQPPFRNSTPKTTLPSTLFTFICTSKTTCNFPSSSLSLSIRRHIVRQLAVRPAVRSGLYRQPTDDSAQIHLPVAVDTGRHWRYDHAAVWRGKPGWVYWPFRALFLALFLGPASEEIHLHSSSQNWLVNWFKAMKFLIQLSKFKFFWLVFLW